MSKKTVELRDFLCQHRDAEWVATMWDRFNKQRQIIKSEWLELQKYIFATDTRTTSNHSNPWKNSTTIPKLCQIRDNLHSNYMSSILPNDDWLTWLPENTESAKKEVAKLVCGFVQYKMRQTDFHSVISRLVLDYIDFGNAFAAVSWEENLFTNEQGEVTPQYVGARLKRISPYDIVFDPTAPSFSDAPIVVRSNKSLGEIKALADKRGGGIWGEYINSRKRISDGLLTGYTYDDVQKADLYRVDGFGNLFDYYGSNTVEILDFYGDFHNSVTGELEQNMHIIVADRRFVVYKGKAENWFGGAPIFHTGWRKRPDNLWCMSPLANLVGLQYRLDHLENLKADAMDLSVHPPLVVAGEVGEFEWAPGAVIHIENGDSNVTELGRNLNGILIARSEMADIEARMELYAGAPREAMGVRSPGEKTAFEVQTLDNAASRIFLEKCVQFEVELLEPAVNSFLETSIRNLDEETIPLVDEETGATLFESVTKDDLTNKGFIKPVGARYFAKKHQDLQNLVGVMNSPLFNVIAPHMSSKALSRYINDILNLKGYEIFKDFISVEENAELEQFRNLVGEAMMAQDQAPVAENHEPALSEGGDTDEPEMV